MALFLIATHLCDVELRPLQGQVSEQL